MCLPGKHNCNCSLAIKDSCSEHATFHFFFFFLYAFPLPCPKQTAWRRLSVGKVKQKVINAFVEIFFKNFRLYRQWRNCMSEATPDIICWHEMNMNNRIISVILQEGFFFYFFHIHRGRRKKKVDTQELKPSQFK